MRFVSEGGVLRSESKAVQERAIARKLEIPEIHISRYMVAFLEGENTEMQRPVAWGAGKPGGEDELASTQSDAEAYIGRFGRAQSLFETAFASAQKNELRETAAYWRLKAVLRRTEVGDYPDAKGVAASALTMTSNSTMLSVAAISVKYTFSPPRTELYRAASRQLPHFQLRSYRERRGKFTLVNIAAVLIITCVVQACSSCSRFSDSRTDSVRRAQEERVYRPVLPPCPSAPYPVLKMSTPGVGHHRVFLSWDASSSSIGSVGAHIAYCLYRSQKKGAAKISATCPDCEQVTVDPIRSTRCVDNVVRDQTTYYYVAVAITSMGRTSSPTQEAIAKVPVAGRTNAAPADATAYPACRAPASSATLR